jgi:hypothetical protein
MLQMIFIYKFHEAANKLKGMIIAILGWIGLLSHMYIGTTITKQNLI